MRGVRDRLPYLHREIDIPKRLEMAEELLLALSTCYRAGELDNTEVANQLLKELKRVLRPAGRVRVICRSVDFKGPCYPPAARRGGAHDD